MTMTFANCTLDEDFEIDCALNGFEPETVSAKILTGDVHAYNGFDSPDNVCIRSCTADIASGRVCFELPRCSVVTVILK